MGGTRRREHVNFGKTCNAINYLFSILPPHTGIGDWDDSLQNCLSLVPKPPKKDLLKELQFDGVTLRYKAELVTPLRDDKMRRFVVTFYPCDDTVSINEESIQNSGFPGGAFLKRSRVPKPDTGLSVKPEFYSAADFYIGAEIRACGKLFVLTDADRFVLTFMEQHPEIYPNGAKIGIGSRYTYVQGTPPSPTYSAGDLAKAVILLVCRTV
ncbi:EF-hand domain-containing protein 1 [Araneus ventricosus]|uniref:EF-hand domain-containing protein 1 n=1 Tax=Araneus ventricosus TaxID=182803 RepID=A0A4Y2VTN5_ARAVE|nr:EF-hand domain-containing protein 1 [Araneus ventricosus]